MSFYKDHYDVVIIGGALAGMSACLQLQAWGIKDILILEKHNMPGGLATDFVRNGFEIEATLHEMMSIGQPGKRLKVGKFFDDMGVDIKWLPVPECYRVALPNSGIDKVLHPDYDDSYTTVAKEIDEVVPGTYDKVHELMLLCRRVAQAPRLRQDRGLHRHRGHRHIQASQEGRGDADALLDLRGQPDGRSALHHLRLPDGRLLHRLLCLRGLQPTSSTRRSRRSW